MKGDEREPRSERGAGNKYFQGHARLTLAWQASYCSVRDHLVQQQARALSNKQIDKYTLMRIDK